MNNLKSIITTLKEAMDKIKKKDIKLSEKTDFTDYKATEGKYVLERYKNNLNKLQHLINFDKVPTRANELIRMLSYNDIDNNIKILDELQKFDIHMTNNSIETTRLPEQIKDEVKADADELEKCFKSCCYRSCVILCGRIIEVCLHAKYFKETGFDILEKNPGIGLGKLIAKMSDKGIKLDPGLNQQIHLINNIRVFSVHKKQRAFMPSRQQTEAIMLYTSDVIGKLF